MTYRSDIDGLRAVAVVAVILFHAKVTGFSGGYVGVDVFFVISGFLITQILRKDHDAGRYSILKFYERRARRILPAKTSSNGPPKIYSSLSLTRQSRDLQIFRTGTNLRS